MIKKNITPEKSIYPQGYSANLQRIATLLRRRKWSLNELAAEIGSTYSNTATYLSKLSKFETVVSERVRFGEKRGAVYHIPKKTKGLVKKTCPCCGQSVE